MVLNRGMILQAEGQAQPGKARWAHAAICCVGQGASRKLAFRMLPIYLETFKLCVLLISNILLSILASTIVDHVERVCKYICMQISNFKAK